MPAALLARVGRATAEQVVDHVAERMAAPRERGFRARFAGREFRPGMERDFALGFLSQFGQPMGLGPGGAAPIGAASMGANPMGAGSMGVTAMGGAPMGAHLSGHGSGSRGMTGQHSPTGGGMATAGYGPAGGNTHGGGLLGSFLPGGDLFSDSEFEMNREQRGGIFSVWSRRLPLVLRRQGGRAVAGRRRAHHDARGRLPAGPAHRRPLGRPHHGDR